MVSMEKLMEMKAYEQNKLDNILKKTSARKEKRKLKEEIRGIKAEKLRATIGVEKKDIQNIGSAFKGAFKGSGKVLKFTGKALLGAGEGVNQMYGVPMGRKAPTKRTKRKKAKAKKRKKIKATSTSTPNYYYEY